jgi:hypothetical protein
MKLVIDVTTTNSAASNSRGTLFNHCATFMNTSFSYLTFI